MWSGCVAWFIILFKLRKVRILEVIWILLRGISTTHPPFPNVHNLPTLPPIDLWMMQTQILEQTIFRGFFLSFSFLSQPSNNLRTNSLHLAVCLFTDRSELIAEKYDVYVVLLWHSLSPCMCVPISKECIVYIGNGVYKQHKSNGSAVALYGVALLEPEYSIWNLLYWVVVTFTSQDKLHILRERNNNDNHCYLSIARAVFLSFLFSSFLPPCQFSQHFSVWAHTSKINVIPAYLVGSYILRLHANIFRTRQTKTIFIFIKIILRTWVDSIDMNCVQCFIFFSDARVCACEVRVWVCM